MPAASSHRSWSRKSGEEIADVPAPPGGFKLPFTLRVPETGHLVVLDNAGFPPMGPPKVFDYSYAGDADAGTFRRCSHA